MTTDKTETTRDASGGYWFGPKMKTEHMVKLWKSSRKNGAVKIGGKISAERKKEDSKVRASIISDRWPLSSKEWPTKVLLKEAGISLNTAKAHLGKRPIAQYNYQAKMKRAANKVKK